MGNPDFRAVQYAFAAHLRDPAANAAPGAIEERRLRIYRELFYNNIEGFLSSFFPVLRSLYADADWHAMARHFFASHQCHTPYFLEIAEEFLRYLDDGHVPVPADPPYLKELAHYEWLELAVDVAEEEIPQRGFNPGGDLLAGVPLLSPLAVLGVYQWPVHRIAADARPDAPVAGGVFLVIYRDRDDRVRFLEVNAVTARLFGLMRERPLASGRELALAVAAEIGHADTAAVVAGAGEMLALLHARDIILGTRVIDVDAVS